MRINAEEFFRVLQEELKPTGDTFYTSDMSLELVNRISASKSASKKFEAQTVTADAAALELFKSSNARCKQFRLDPKSKQDEEVIGEVKSLLDGIFFCGPELTFDPSCLLERFDVGPGASVDVESFNFYTKLFDSPLTCTSELLYREYRCAIASHPTWTSAEKARWNKHGLKVVGGNRLSFVAKTKDISRSICTEPTLNMLFQKGLGSFLEDMLWKRFKISLSRQPSLNRTLARRGSIDGSFGTIDLQSASDSVSLDLVKELLPKYFLRWLLLSRSPKVCYPDGSEDELHMLSSMGNAFTFPLQTMLFASIVVACYRVLGVNPRFDRNGPSNFGVFGDDIIVRSDAYEFVCRALRLFGFIVNDSKSFNTGYFRESCGEDWWKGHNVRGFYLRSLKTSADVYSAINRIVRWTARTGIFLPNSIELLRKSVKHLPIPPDRGDAEGIKVPRPAEWMKNCPKTGGVIYSFLSKVGTSFRMPPDETTVLHYPRKGRRRKPIFYNPDGIMLTLLGGYIRNGRIGVRENSKTERFKVRRYATSSWGSVTAADPIYADRAGDWVVTCELYGISP